MIERGQTAKGDGRLGKVDRLLTTAEAAYILHVHANTVRKWSRLGLIPSYRVGPRGDRRFEWQDIRKFAHGQDIALEL